jgi:tetratricopeptide (TPR) repeat protein
MPAAIPVALVATLLLAPATGSAEALYRRGMYSAAIAVLDRAEPDAANLELLGQSYFMLGDFKNATDALQRAAALDPADSMIQTWLGRAWGRRAETSFAISALGHAAKTREAFEKALQLNPRNTEALGDLFDYYMDAPAIAGGGVEKARGLLPQFTRYDPVGFLLAQARIDEKKKQFESAETGFRRAVEAAPAKVGLLIDLAQFLSRRGRYDESENVFRQASNLAPDSPRIPFARADSYIKARRNIAQARDLLRKYIAADHLTPDDPPRWEAQNLLKKAEGG